MAHRSSVSRQYWPLSFSESSAIASGRLKVSSISSSECNLPQTEQVKTSNVIIPSKTLYTRDNELTGGFWPMAVILASQTSNHRSDIVLKSYAFPLHRYRFDGSKFVKLK